jgi:serine/threonine-protein kinase
VSSPADADRRSRLETSLLESKLLTSDEAREAGSCDQGFAGWIKRQRLLPEPLLEQAERGEPLRLGRYVVTGRVGKGGMGAVLRARDDRLGREVAIKVLRPLDAEEAETLRARFRREALALARLSHPGIVRVYDLEEEAGLMFLVLELVVGYSLEERLRAKGPLDERDARRLLRQVIQAMSAAEAQGLVHRDLKPGNLLWVPEGDLYKVCDFGLVRFLEGATGAEAGGTLTQACMLLGTPFYMSPEQVLARPLDVRSDMYSMGLTMHELLTGKVPFEGVRLEQVLKRRLHEDVPSVRALAPAVSVAFARVIGAMTQRDRERRPASWRALAALLAASDDRDTGRHPRVGSATMRSASGERQAARAVSERAPAVSAARTRRVPVAALVVLALTVGAAAGGLLALLAR